MEQNEKMKIIMLLISLPDVSVNSGLYLDLLAELKKQGHDVNVVAPALLDEKTKISIEKGITILRVKTLPLFSKSLIIKGIANLLIPFQYKKAIKKFYKNSNYDLVLMPTPPVMLVTVASWIKRHYKSKFYLMLKDIFPQNAVDLGMIKKGSLLYRYFRNKEIYIYREADLIGCMSPGNKRYILKHNTYIDEKKVHILRNSEKSIKNLNPDSLLQSEYGLNNKFTLVFGGNMSAPQQMENIIYFAKECQNRYNDVQFLLIGKGTQIENIKKKIIENKINNIILKNYVPSHQYLKLVSQCQVGLISLHKDFTIPNIPSKVMSYLNCSLPVLASIDKNTDFGDILEKNNFGFVSIAGDINKLLNNFDKLYKSAELRKTMGFNGKKYLEEYLSPEIAVNTIISHVKKLF